MLEVKESIDQESYPENYNALLYELSKRSTELEKRSKESSEKLKQEEETRKISCSISRVTWVLSFGFYVSFPFVVSAEPSYLKGDDKFYVIMLLLMSGLPLLHSFYCGWTLAKHGIVTITDDKFSFTVMQLFYSYVFFITLLFAVARWP